MDKEKNSLEKKRKSPFPLQVPSDKDIRTEIKDQVETFFRLNEVMPPISYDTLEKYAVQLIKDFGWDEMHKAFVMVCCGNAIWRRVVGSVPYNRRILLLPHCLKNMAFCKAETDELGLLCRECGKCSISGFLKEAETLGYIALVTEGTTVTTKLIESGKVDAILGVGCMDVLQKMFASVSKYSIPGIGIPLLTCGCQDTLADSEWIKEEIYHFRENENIRLLNLNHLQNKTSSFFEEKQVYRFFGDPKTTTEKLAINSLLSGGQRIRPFLAVLAYEAFCKYPDTTLLHRLAISVECFHKASLIHDDIEDNDEFRYGKETLHSQYGTAIAINCGDFLLGEGYRLLAESGLAEDMVNHCFQIVSTGHKNLTIGQGEELLSINQRKILPPADMLTIFENKTAAAFKVSLLLGATMGEADAVSLKKLDEFCHHTGIAYQLKDDIEDFHGEKGDIEKRNFSILLSLLSVEVPNLMEHLESKNYNSIYELFQKFDILKKTEHLLLHHIQEAKNSLENFENMGLKLALHEILGKIFKAYL